MKRYTFFLMMTTSLFFTFACISWAANEAQLGLVFDKPFYEPNQSFSLSVTIKNLSKNKLSNTKAILTIENPENGEKIYERKFYPGSIFSEKTKKFSLKKDVSNLNLSEGVYPVQLRFIKENEVLVEKQTFLTILDEVKMPLAVALIWNLHETAHFNPQGIFLDNELQVACDKKGVCQKHLEALNAHPAVNVSMNITPLFVEQLRDISDGYKILAKGKIKNIGENSKEAQRATKILEGFERAIKNKQLELMPAPYSYPLLNELTNEEWGADDADLQVALGKEVIMKTFHLSEEPKGMFSPNLTSNLNSLSCLRSEDIEYTVLNSNLFGPTVGKSEGLETKDIFKPYRVQNIKGDRVSVLFADEEISNSFVKKEDPHEAVQLLAGQLAQIYLKEPYKQKIVVIVPDSPGWQPSTELLENIYLFLEGPWLNPVTLDIAFELGQTPSQPIELLEPRREKSYLQVKYDENIGLAHTELSNFGKVVEDDNPLLNKLHKQILIAEANDWRLSENPVVANRGLAFLTNVIETIDSELDKVFIEPKARLKNNEAQIIVRNRSDYDFNVFVNLNSGTGKRVILKPEKNLVNLPLDNQKSYAYRQAGGQKIKVFINNGDKNIKEASVTLFGEQSSKKTWYVALIGSFALIILTSAAIIWFFNRRKVKNHERTARKRP